MFRIFHQCRIDGVATDLIVEVRTMRGDHTERGLEVTLDDFDVRRLHGPPINPDHVDLDGVSAAVMDSMSASLLVTV